MKRPLLAILVVVAAFGFACVRSAPSSSNTSTPTENAPPEAPAAETLEREKPATSSGELREGANPNPTDGGRGKPTARDTSAPTTK